MEEPIKKSGNFVPKMFKVFTLYIFVAVSVFFGYVQIFGNIAPSIITLPTDGANAEDDSYFGNLVANMMEMDNVSVEGFSLAMQSGDGKTDLAINGNVTIDASTQDISMDIDLVYNNQTFDVGAVYSKPYLFLSIENSTYKIDTTSNAEGNMDISGVLNFITQALNIDMSFVTEIGDFLGIDLNNINLDQLQSQLKITPKKLEDNSFEFIVHLGTVISAQIFCDENYNITQIKLQDILVKGNLVKFSAPSVVMNNDENVDKIVVPSTDEIIDMCALTNFGNYAKNLFANNFVSSDISFNFKDKVYAGHLIFDNSEKFKVLFNTNIEGIDVSIAFADNKIFVDAQSLKLSFTLDDFDKWETEINDIFVSQTSKTVAEFVKEIVESKFNTDLENVDTNEEILSLLNKFFAGSDKINALLPDKTIELASSFEMLWANGLNVSLFETEGLLSGFDVKLDQLKLSAQFVVVHEGFEIYDGYYDVSNLLPLVDVVDEILSNNQFGGQIMMNVASKQFEAQYAFDFKNGILAQISINIGGENLNVYLNQDSILLVVGDIVVEGQLSNLQGYLQKIDDCFATSIENNYLQISSKQIDIKNIVATVCEVLKNINISAEDGKIAVLTYLQNTFNLTVNDNIVVAHFEKDQLAFDFEIKATNENIVVPNKTDDLSNVLNKIENLKNYAETKQYAFDFVVNYFNFHLTGKLQIDLINNVFEISNVEIGQNILKVAYSNKVVFVEYGDIKLKLSVDKVEDIITILQPIINQNFDSETSVDISSLLTNIFGEDVSKLSMEEAFAKIKLAVEGTLDALDINVVFEAVKVFEAQLNITFQEDMFKSIDFNLYDILGSLQVVEFNPIAIDENVYFNITSAHKGKAVFTYQKAQETIVVEADLEINLSDKIYAKLSCVVANMNVEIVVFNNKYFATIGDLVVSGDFNGAKTMFDEIVELFEIVVPETQIDFIEILKNLDLNKINILDLKNMVLSVDGETIVFEYQPNETLNLNFEIFDEQTLNEIVLPQSSVDVMTLIRKIDSVVDYVEKGIFEFDFSASYNGLEFSGVLKMFENSIEISDMILAGEYLNVRIEGNAVYLAYGNMKLKFEIPQNSSGGIDSNVIADAIDKLTGGSLGVEINFGVFEEVLNILKNYTFNDYLKNMIVRISDNLDTIGFEINHKNDMTISQIVNGTLNFDQNNLNSISLSVYEIVKVNLVVKNSSESTIKPFDPQEYQDYTNDFVDGMLNSLKAYEGVYAFSSDIAIRYSNNNFYGQITAILVEDMSKQNFLGNYTPAISLTTSSLGLNTYIYLIDQTVYIDINGLQISADLSKTTIDEILQFVENNLGIMISGQSEAVGMTVEAFKVILPALDKIYGSWVVLSESIISNYNGIQIDIRDDLWYSATSKFSDIVAQIFIANYEKTIVPTKIVLGANIDDPNTTIYEDYSDFWLTNGKDVNGNAVILENEVTKKLNFAVYLTNISVGSYISDLDSKFVCLNHDFANITALKSNYGTSLLSDFNSYNTLLEMIDVIYSYGLSNKYQMNVNGTMAGAKTSTIDADVVVELGDLKEGELNEDAFNLFDGKYLKVQGNVDFTGDVKASSQTKHLLDIFYESNNSSALYATYSHAEYINSGDKFKAKINNANLSEIMAMIFKFANINLGEKMTSNLGLPVCPTDFTFLQKLLGIGGADIGDDVSKVDKILSSVENMTKLLKQIKLDKTEIGNGLNEIRFTITIDLEGNLSQIEIILRDELQENGQIVKKLKQISIDNMMFNNTSMDFVVSFEDFKESSFDYNKDETHLDFSEISSFVDVAVNTINTKGFSFTGSADVSIIGINAITVNYDLFVSIDDNGEIYFYLELDVPSFIDVTYDAGGFGSTYTYYSALMGFSNRISVLEYKDGILSVVQTTYGFKQSAFHSSETRVKSWTHTSEEIGTDIMKIMAETLGLTDTVYNSISGLIAKMNPNPSLEKTILGFAKLENGYKLSVDGETLTGDSNFSDMDLIFGVSDKYVCLDGKTYQFIDSVSTTLNIGGAVEIPVNLKSTNQGTSYTTGAGKSIYTNDYYRKIYIDEARYKKVTFKTYCNTSAFDSALLTVGQKIIFPTLTTKDVTVDEVTTFYQFDGWYWDSLFKKAVDTENVYMSEENMIFYAKWKVVKVEKTSAVNIYDNGELVTTLRVKSGDVIDLSSLDRVTSTTKFYYDENYQTEMTDFVMPENEVNIHLRNLYTVTVTSGYGNGGATWTEYQGTEIVMPQQQSYVEDDGVTRTTYNFLGYTETLSEVPNRDVTIVANWEVETKRYYTLSFNTTFVAPNAWLNNNNSFTGKITCKTPANSIDSIKVLEGTVVDLTQYSVKAVYDYTAVWITATYNFKVVSWNTSGCETITDGVSNYSYTEMNSYTVTSNTTLYAIWGKQ